MIRCPVCKNLFNRIKETIECPACSYHPLDEDGIIRFAIPERDEYFFPVEGFSTLYQHEADHFWFRSRNKVIGSFIERYISNTSDTQICEIGCGTGLVSQYLSHKGYRLSCCDLYLEGLLYAKERESGERYYVCNLYEFPFFEEFNAILVCDVLEHLEDDAAALCHLYDALLPGGICLITVPAGKNLWSKIDTYAGHKRRYNSTELKLKVKEAGFIFIRISYFMTVLYPILWIKRILMDHLFLSAENMNTDIIVPNELSLPTVLNHLLYHLLLLERMTIPYINLPIGSSLICIAQKPIIK